MGENYSQSLTGDLVNQLHAAEFEKLKNAMSKIVIEINQGKNPPKNEAEIKYVKSLMPILEDPSILVHPSKLQSTLGTWTHGGNISFAVFMLNRLNLNDQNIDTTVDSIINAVENRSNRLYDDDKNLDKWLQRDTLLTMFAVFLSIHEQRERERFL